VGIAGTDRLRRVWWSVAHHPKVTVTIGKLLNPPQDGRLNREQRQEMIDIIMKKVAALVPPQYRGVYAGGEDAAR
jgi:hypothetical protein